MATLIFDIETVGENWNELDAITQESLSHWIHKTAKNKNEEEVLMQDLKDNLRFSPLSGSIASIGLFDRERGYGAVYYSSDAREGDIPSGAYILKQRDEKEMLEDFWEGAQSYDTFVSFNGRRFDVPFLMHRSVVHGIVPSCNLMEGRYLHQQKSVRHVDLLDQFSFYGALPKKGNVHLYCRTYGIQSPLAEGTRPLDTQVLFAQKKFRDIAKYNALTVTATVQLYEKWLTHFNPQAFDTME